MQDSTIRMQVQQWGLRTCSTSYNACGQTFQFGIFPNSTSTADLALATYYAFATSSFQVR